MKQSVTSGYHIGLANPISSERVILRRTLLNSLLENLALNLKHRHQVAIFEIGRVYLPEAGDGILPAEPRRLALAVAGPREPRSWTAASPALLDFFDLKGVIETLLNRLHFRERDFVPVEFEIQIVGSFRRDRGHHCTCAV